MNSLTSPTLAGRPVVLRILRYTQKLGGLLYLNLGVRYRRLCRPIAPVRLDWPHPLSATLKALLQGCAADLRTFLRRMECRFDALPETWTYDAGPCFERDPNGNLRPNRDSDAYMIDIENFQKGRPTETLFDEELFHSGWVAGAKYGMGKSCREDTEEKSCNPPNRNRIPDSQESRRRV